MRGPVGYGKELVTVDRQFNELSFECFGWEGFGWVRQGLGLVWNGSVWKGKARADNSRLSILKSVPSSVRHGRERLDTVRRGGVWRGTGNSR